MYTYFISSGYLKDFDEKPDIEFRVEDRNTPEKAKYGTDFRVVLYVNGEWENEWDNWWSLEQAEEIAAKKQSRVRIAWIGR